MNLENDGLLSLQELKEKIQFDEKEYLAKVKVQKERGLTRILINYQHLIEKSIVTALNNGYKFAQFKISNHWFGRENGTFDNFLRFLKNKGYDVTFSVNEDNSFNFYVRLLKSESDV